MFRQSPIRVAITYRNKRLVLQKKLAQKVNNRITGHHFYSEYIFTGTIRYFNNVMNEYNVSFDDGSQNYSREANLDGGIVNDGLKDDGMVYII